VKVLVVNCGSSSLKYSLFDIEPAEADPASGPPGAAGDGATAPGRVLVSGIVERLGQPEPVHRHRAGGEETARPVSAPDHGAAFDLVLAALTEGPGAVLPGPDAVEAVGHRVVHGGERFAGSVRIDTEVIEAVEACADLAPLHNPPNLVGIRAAMTRIPHAVHVAVFDTAFHQTLEPEAFLYALPYELYRDHGVRRYGFHGTSHRYVSEVAVRMLGRPAETVNLITAHLGNGCSASAVRGGRCVDTSLGMTPLEGLVMGTRSGDIDPAIVFHLVRALGMTVDEVDDLLNRRSGLLGLSGISNDMREVLRAAEAGDERADLAVRIFCRRLRKYIGAYTAVLGRVDALVFTGGIGENAAPVRERTCRGLEPLGYVLDPAANAAPAEGPRDVAAADSSVRILVIPTDEEALIAREAARLATCGA